MNEEYYLDNFKSELMEPFLNNLMLKSKTDPKTEQEAPKIMYNFLKMHAENIQELVRRNFNGSNSYTKEEIAKLLLTFEFIEIEKFDISPDPLFKLKPGSKNNLSLHNIWEGTEDSFNKVLDLLVHYEFCVVIIPQCSWFAKGSNIPKLAALSWALEEKGYLKKGLNRLQTTRIFCRTFGIVYTGNEIKYFKNTNYHRVKDSIEDFDYIPQMESMEGKDALKDTIWD